MSLSYPNFQIILHKSDPRTVLVFNHPLGAIWSHILTLSKELNCDVVRYPALPSSGVQRGESEEEPTKEELADSLPHAAGSASRGLRSGSFFSMSGAAKIGSDTTFQDVFDDCFDNGKWLVIDNMSQVSHTAWRYVGQRLAGVLPAREFHLRKHFRAISFLSPGLEPHTLAPALLCQFALVVDLSGDVHAKSEVGPLFETEEHVADISSTIASAKRALAETGAAVAASAAVEGKEDGTNRAQPYLTVTQSKKKLQVLGGNNNTSFHESALNASQKSLVSSDDGFEGSSNGHPRGVVDLADPERPGALDEQYIDELVSCLKEDLLSVQAEMIEAVNERIEKAIAEADAQAAHNMAGALFGSDDEAELDTRPTARGGSDRGRVSERELEDRRKALFDTLTREANDDYDWIYPEMAQWVITQAPRVNFRIIPKVREEQISVEDVLWTSYSQTAYRASWNGSEVMLHRPVQTYTTHAADLIKDEMQREAATHFNLRHPSIVAFYGVLASDDCSLVTEAGIGSLEQAFVRARHNCTHWLVRDYLALAQNVLQGLTFLSATMSHRDIACRSIIEIQEKGLYKIGRFGLAQSNKGYVGDDNAKVAVRWSAPEALTGVFSHKSDMWSFGMLMWEALHYVTSLPYGNFSQAGDAILRGEVEKCQTVAAVPLYNMLCAPCFQQDPDARPHAGVLLVAVERAMLQWDKSLLDQEVPFPNQIASTA